MLQAEVASTFCRVLEEDRAGEELEVLEEQVLEEDGGGYSVDMILKGLGGQEGAGDDCIGMGDRVQVKGGKYDGKSATVCSVGASTCKLELGDGSVTGNVRMTCLTKVSGSGGERRVAVEVDGPSHFVSVARGEVGGETGWRVNGSTLLKRRLLAGFGWEVLSVPFFEWNANRGKAAKEAYVRRLLQGAGVFL